MTEKMTSRIASSLCRYQLCTTCSLRSLQGYCFPIYVMFILVLEIEKTGNVDWITRSKKSIMCCNFCFFSFCMQCFSSHFLNILPKIILDSAAEATQAEESKQKALLKNHLQRKKSLVNLRRQMWFRKIYFLQVSVNFIHKISGQKEEMIDDNEKEFIIVKILTILIHKHIIKVKSWMQQATR